ncbi:PREDICTED: uncharacterized protein LOC104813516 [Tarenaya hassleriana]|uniref:uncharacterized protein LOC104813516 n=1 Tax=Tarenaya hassleriana TaxID=28532 RepID=UPI00053C5B0E|nr:PREDICTED: uncharacterized protein LOC104813516 [Tarenaya hassleriana]
MEGVGARLGRSSTRYGPATVFTGPVRKWKKKWVHVSPSNKKDTSSATAVNGGSAADGSNGPHLLLYKWAPLFQSSNGNGGGSGKSESNSPSDDSGTAAEEEPPRRKFKYVPIAVLEEQKRDTTEIEDEDKVEEDAKPSDNDAADSKEKNGGLDEKPDINDVPVEDNKQEDGKMVRQDLNKSSIDLSLNLNAHDGDSENDQTADILVEG